MKIRSSHIVTVVGLVIFGFVLLAVLRAPSQGTVEPDGASATAGEVPPAASTEAQPQLVPEKEFVDMGTISNQGPSTYDLRLSNNGTAPLQIHSVQGSCSCITATVADNVVAPGASTTMTIQMDPFKIPTFDVKGKTVSIMSNDPSRGKGIIIPVVCKIEPEFALETETINLGDVTKGEVAEKTVRLTQLRDEPVEVTGLDTGAIRPPGVELSYEKVPQEQWADPSKAEYLITARLTPEVPLGPVAVPFRILTNVERLQKVRGFPSAVVGTVKSFYTITPNGMVQLSLVHPGQQDAGTITIRSDRVIEVTDVRVHADNVSATVRQEDDPYVAYIDLGIPQDARQGRVRARLSFSVSSGAETSTESVEVLGLVKQQVAAAE